MGTRVASATLTASHITASALTSRVASTVVVHTTTVIVHTAMVVVHTAMVVVHTATVIIHTVTIVVHTSTVVVHTTMVVVHTATIIVHTAMVVTALGTTLVSSTEIVVATGSMSGTATRHVVSSATVNTVVMRPARCGMHDMRPVSRTHGMEVAPSTILMIITRHGVVEIGVASVVSIDAEAPSIVSEYDRTIEVVVGHVTRPLGCREQTTKREVAVIKDVIVLCIGVAISHIVEVLVHTVDVIIIDHIDQVYDVCPQTKGEGHTVSEETGVVAHHSVRHGLGIHHICHCQHHYCYKHCSNLSHSRYGFVESGA